MTLNRDTRGYALRDTWKRGGVKQFTCPPFRAAYIFDGFSEGETHACFREEELDYLTPSVKGFRRQQRIITPI